MKRLLLSIFLLAGAGVLAGCTTRNDLNINGEADLTTNVQEGGTTGTMIDANGTIRYRGEIENEIQNGSGTAYDASGNVLYVGMRHDGEAEWEGILYYSLNNTIAYEGEREDGQPEWEGKRFYTNGKVAFEGNFNNGNPSGEGKLYDVDGNLIFDGKFGGAVDLSWVKTATGTAATGDYRVDRTSGFIDETGKLHTSILFYAEATARGVNREPTNSNSSSSSTSTTTTSDTNSMLHIGGQDDDDESFTIDIMNETTSNITNDTSMNNADTRSNTTTDTNASWGINVDVGGILSN